MTRPLVSFVLAFWLAGGTAFADGIRSSIRPAVEAELAAQARQRARGENELMVPGVVMLAAGGSLLMLAFLAPSGVKCEETGRGFGVSCGTTANKGLLFGGLGAMGVGGYLILRGEQQRNRPFVAPAPGGFVAGHRIAF